MKKYINNEKGVTLVELLASIVILSIILITSITFFTNSFHYNSISSNKLKATNLARETQESFKVNPDMNLELKNLLTQAKGLTGPKTFPKATFPKLKLKQDIQLDSSGTLRLSLINPNYQVLVIIDNNPVNDLTSPLYKLQVQVLENTRVLTETFSYFEL